MPGRPQKTAGALTGHRAAEGPDLRILAAQEPPKPDIPSLPPGRWLRVTRDRWAAYWTSSIAWNTDRQCDATVALRWISALDEWERANRQLRKSDRLVKGSTGQDRLNPLVGYIRGLEETMRREERQLGGGALNRSILMRLAAGGPPIPPPGAPGPDDVDDWTDDDPAADVTWVER